MAETGLLLDFGEYPLRARSGRFPMTALKLLEKDLWFKRPLAGGVKPEPGW